MSGESYSDAELRYLLNNFYRLPVSEMCKIMYEKFGTKRSTAGLYGKWKSMMVAIQEKYMPRIRRDSKGEEIDPGLTPYQKDRMRKAAPIPAITTRDLIMAMGESHSITSLAMAAFLETSVVADMVLVTGVPKKHAVAIRRALRSGP